MRRPSFLATESTGMDRWDLAFIGGLACVGAGLWICHPWIALTIVGTVVCVMALVSSKTAKRGA